MSRPPLSPFTRETAAQKARMAEDAWNSPACGQRAEIFQLSTYLSGLPAAAADPRAFCFITASKGGSSARAAVRWSIHLLVRLAIAATCNSPAAAFDAAHLLHAAEACCGTVTRSQSVGVKPDRIASRPRPVVPYPASRRLPRNRRGHFNQTRQRSSEHND
jgi:hypothetical protein